MPDYPPPPPPPDGAAPFGNQPPPPPGGDAPFGNTPPPPPPGGAAPFGNQPPPPGDAFSNAYGPPPATSSMPPVWNAGPAPSTAGKGLSIASLVCGILAIVLACFCGVGMLFAIPGIITGAMGYKAAKAAGAATGMSVAGLILSGVAAAVAAVVLVLLGTGSYDFKFSEGMTSINSDKPDGSCNTDRLFEDPDC